MLQIQSLIIKVNVMYPKEQPWFRTCLADNDAHNVDRQCLLFTGILSVPIYHNDDNVEYN